MTDAVLPSLESEDGTQCVDFFVRADGTYGFEQYRREYDGRPHEGRKTGRALFVNNPFVSASYLSVAVPGGFQALSPLLRLPRHRHATPYAALVLSGGYVEAGDAGRRRMAAGDVAFHRTFEAHANVVTQGGARILNLPLRSAPSDAAFGRVGDADSIARAAEHDAADAGDMLQAISSRCTCDVLDWPDELARDLRSSSPVVLAQWALRHGLAPETVSRSFRSVFGVSPKRYRLEQHALAALRLLEMGSMSIADTAAAAGFADQAHLSRTVVALTGRTPRSFRA